VLLMVFAVGGVLANVGKRVVVVVAADGVVVVAAVVAAAAAVLVVGTGNDAEMPRASGVQLRRCAPRY
jgi:hypothetical protein